MLDKLSSRGVYGPVAWIVLDLHTESFLVGGDYSSYKETGRSLPKRSSAAPQRGGGSTTTGTSSFPASGGGYGIFGAGVAARRSAMPEHA
jgi:hypothetical protein